MVPRPASLLELPFSSSAPRSRDQHIVRTGNQQHRRWILSSRLFMGRGRNALGWGLRSTTTAIKSRGNSPSFSAQCCCNCSFAAAVIQLASVLLAVPEHAALRIASSVLSSRYTVSILLASDRLPAHVEQILQMESCMPHCQACCFGGHPQTGHAAMSVVAGSAS